MEIIKKNLLGTILVVVIAGATAGGGYAWGLKTGRQMPKVVEVRGIANGASPSAGDADFGQFWEVWQAIKENYLLDEKVSNKEKVYGATQGLVQSLGDPYSEFFTPEEGKKFQEDVRGDFSGIGAEIGIRKGQLTVIAPLKGTPAELAGLKPGDMILSINTSSTDGIGIDEAVRMIRGPSKSTVTLNVFRENWDAPKDIAIVRDTIQVPTVEFEMKEGGVAYIGLASFNANAGQLFAGAASKVLQNDARGILLDLRNNPGGYLDTAVNIAGWFFPRDTLVVSEAGRTGNNEQLMTYGNGGLKDLPVVVLINQGSASASEILAGALRDNRDITLVGERSFGKGTVQEIIPLSDDASMKLTIAHWVLPKGAVLENGGLMPDIEVKVDDDTPAGKDPQMEKALTILQSEITK
jgi:carboxyl-terminal processing protease